MTNIKIHNKGFTLIELLVVIAIIGLLSSVVLASLNEAKNKAEDSKTAQQIRQYQIAIASFYYDTGGYPYPGDLEYHCLGPVGTTCRVANSSLITNTASNMGELALIHNKENPQYAEDDSFFSKIANAATLSNYITPIAIKTPDVNVGGLNYLGAAYKCAHASGGKCLDGNVYWVNLSATTCGSKGRTWVSGSGKSACVQDAANTGTGYTYY